MNFVRVESDTEGYELSDKDRRGRSVTGKDTLTKREADDVLAKRKVEGSQAAAGAATSADNRGSAIKEMASARGGGETERGDLREGKDSMAMMEIPYDSLTDMVCIGAGKHCGPEKQSAAVFLCFHLHASAHIFIFL